MSKIIVADTGPLIALALVELLPVLHKLFPEVCIPLGVLAEVTEDVAKPGALAITGALDKGWITAHPVEMDEDFQDLIELLDQGEAEALALAKQLSGVALVDERRGRKVAAKQGIAVTGTAAVLVKAKKAGLIKEVKPLLGALRDHGYRLSERLVSEVLKLAGEGGDG